MTAITKLFDLTGKTAVLTGASYGLGVTFAHALAEHGANLVVAARSQDKLQQLSKELNAAGQKAIAVGCDVGDSAQVKRLMKAAVERFGRIDIVVNNAGVSADVGMTPERLPDENFETTVRVNLMGTFYCCREAAQIMLRDGKGGSIINIASIAGMGGIGNFPLAYQSTKAAVINLTRNLACSWADRGVRVNTLAPGWFPSEMTAGVIGFPPFRQWAEEMAPMRRFGRPEELAPALLFLASDASSFVTGSTLVVDGGVSAAGASPVPEVVQQALAKAMGEVATPIGAKAKAGR